MIGVIGAGKLGSAIAARLAASGEKVVAFDRNKGKTAGLSAAGVEAAASAADAVRKSGVVLLCVKPRDFDSLLSELDGKCAGKLVISVAAGIPIAHIEAKLPGARVVRCLPNMALAIRMSDTGMSFSKKASQGDRKDAGRIFGLLGNVRCIDEGKMAAWTGLSGSFPAYVALWIDAAAKVAESEGFGREEAVKLAASVTMASAKLLLENGEDPSGLVKRVASPGGTTEAGLKVAAENGLQESFSEVLAAAIKRAKEMEKSEKE